MPGADFTDLDWAFATDEFASAASWTAAGGNSAAVTGAVLLDAPDDQAFDDVRASAHRITYRVAEWPGVREGDQVSIGAATYDVARVLALDDGMLVRAWLVRR